MTEWVSAAPALLIAGVLVTLPGLPIAWALRLRGLTLLAGSVAASFAIIAVSSVLAPFLGVSWGLVPLLGVAATLALVALLIRRFLPRTDPVPVTRSAVIATAGALLLAGALVSFELVRAIGSPEHVSQTYDAVFHLNAVAQILGTGDASPLHMNLAAPSQTTVFYPTVWHATVALITSLSSASIPLATNALSIVVGAWVWPIAVLFFAAPFLRGRYTNLLLAAIFAATASAFPYLLLTWGVLYPNFLATALLPLALGFVHVALRPQVLPDAGPRAALWIAAVGALGAASLAHPNAAFACAIIVLPLLLASANDVRRSALAPGAKTIRYGALLLALIAMVAMWSLVYVDDNNKQYESSLVQGVGSALGNAPMVDAKAWFISVFVIAGAVLLLARRRHRWLVASYVMIIAFYAISVGLDGPLRTALTVAWYNDAARLAALLPIATIPLAAIAASSLLEIVSAGISRARSVPTGPRTSRFLPAIALIAVMAIVLTGARGANIGAQVGWMHGLFTDEPEFGREPEMLSADEATLLERLDDTVPEGAKIAGDPWNGTAYAYSLSGRPLLFPHMTAQYDTDAATIAAELNTMGAEACPFLDRLGVKYVLDFGDPNFDTYAPELSQHFQGLRGVGENPVLDEVDREGDAALYRVNCG